MSDKPVRTPRHLWIVGIVSLLWNLMGAFDYVMTETKNAAYLKRFTQEQLDYYYGFPAWLIAFWALAVWGAVLGSILLLLRKKLAVPVFLVSFACAAVTMVYTYGLSGGYDVSGAGGLVFSIVIFAVALVLVIYARRMAARGVLV